MLVSKLFGAASSSDGAIHKALAPASIPLTITQNLLTIAFPARAITFRD
jgi:hypothetical protein